MTLVIYYILYIKLLINIKNMLKINQWDILAINSPSTSIEKIELPWWDPTSLYYAMAIVNKGRSEYIWNLDFDDEIFNPKIWNDKSKESLRKKIENKNPKYVLISNTSPSHPYALEISDYIKSIMSDVIIIIWWPHEDETMIWDNLSNWSTLLDQYKWIISDSIDFVISWDWEYSLEWLLKMLVENNWNKKEIFKSLSELWFFNEINWISTIWTLFNWKIITTKTSWKKIDMWELPSIYEYFNNNSYFDVFTYPNWQIKRTAHIMSARGCTFNCSYCSESTKTYWNANILKKDNFIDHVVNQIKSWINKWSESAFFEDSIFMQWNKGRIINLCDTLIKLKEIWELPNYFEWWCQMTIENVLRFWNESNEILSKMKLAWCTYIFYWIESLSEDIMSWIHKNNIIKNKFYNSWIEKVDQILLISKNIWLKVWASILFWLPWETIETIDYTISWMSKFINEWKLFMVSPNIVTYHPWTELTITDWMQDKLDYTTNFEMIEPYSFFEEASPWKVSIRIDEKTMYYIKEQCEVKLKTLNNTKTISDYSNNKVKDFYSDKWWELLIDNANFPAEIVNFLDNEKYIVSKKIVDWWYDLLFEVWCMNARNLNISTDLWIWYFWIDIVERYIDEAKKIISDNNINNSSVKLLSAFEVTSSNIDIRNSQKQLVLFPFNSFGNIEKIRETLLSFSELWYDIFISTYWTDDESNKIRYSYYENCWYLWLKQINTDEEILFSSDEWLKSYVYKEKKLIMLLEQFWYKTIEVIKYWWIWIWFHATK